MNEKSEAYNLVAIAKSNTPQDTINKGIEKLGGISKFINKDDIIFIKVKLALPELFPVTFNIDTLAQVVSFCRQAGAQKIIIGGYTDEYIDNTAYEQLLGFKSLIESFGVEFQVFQDEMDIEYVNKVVDGNSIKIPRLIMDSDKLISLNQVSVNPLFQLDLAILNSYSIIAPKFQKIEKVEREGKDYLFLDQYKLDLISNILNVYTIKKPTLIINDLYYLLEKAGPYLCKESNIKKTNMMVLGRDALAVDIVTLSLLNLDYLNNPLTSEARLANIGISDMDAIQIVGEKLDESKINISLPISRLDDIKVLNTTIKTGSYCSGCFQEAYRFLNFLKTNMIKDLKYLVNQSFLLGENPQEPDSKENIVLFGDCTIKSTMNRDFRKVFVKTKDFFNPFQILSKKEAKTQKSVKLKEKENKNILELSGCPPNFYQTLYFFIQYYSKKNCPNGIFFMDLFKTYLQLEKFEALLK